MNRDLLHKELTRDEDFRLKAYQDTKGWWTIGIGHYLGPLPRMTEINRREAMALFNSDIDVAEAVVEELVEDFDGLDDVRQRALVNMAFNLGGRLGDFHHFLAAVNLKDWKKAGIEMEDSDWWSQVGERAKRLRVMLETGTA